MTVLQCVKYFKIAPIIETVANIADEFLKEFEAARGKTVIVENPYFSRKAKSKVRIWPWRILNDLDSKWRKFARLANENIDFKKGNVIVFEEGFSKLIEHRYPVIYGTWLMTKIF